MAGHAAVGVDDDLAAGQAGVTHRATDLEAAGRVDERPVAADVEVRAAVAQLGEDRLDDVGADVGLEHALERDVGCVLGREDDGVERHGTVAVVGDGDLGLAVGAQVGELLALAHLGQPLGRDGAPGGSAAASARPCRRRRSRTSGPGRRRPACRAGRRPRRCGARARCRRPGRCRATARRWRSRHRRCGRRSPSATRRSRPRGWSRARSSGSRRRPSSTPRRRRARARS